MEKCSTCNKVVQENYVKLNCPVCGKGTIIRCAQCKANSRTYTCKECGQIGP